MKLLRIISDGTAPGTNFELFDPATGRIEPVELPAARIEWTISGDDVAQLNLTFSMVSLNIMQPTEGVVQRIDDQILKLVMLRDSMKA